MAIRYYDNAIVNKITNWVKDPKLKIIGPNDADKFFTLLADETNDKPISFPAISLSRGDVKILSTTKKALTYDGGHLNVTDKVSQVLNAIPIELSYTISIFTKTFAEADEYARNFIFNLINYPNIEIEIPYNNSKVMHKSNISVDSNIQMSREQLGASQYSTIDINFRVDDAYLFSVPFMLNWSTEISDVELKQ